MLLRDRKNTKAELKKNRNSSHDAGAEQPGAERGAYDFADDAHALELAYFGAVLGAHGRADDA